MSNTFEVGDLVVVDRGDRNDKWNGVTAVVRGKKDGYILILPLDKDVAPYPIGDNDIGYGFFPKSLRHVE